MPFQAGTDSILAFSGGRAGHHQNGIVGVIGHALIEILGGGFFHPGRFDVADLGLLGGDVNGGVAGAGGAVLQPASSKRLDKETTVNLSMRNFSRSA